MMRTCLSPALSAGNYAQDSYACLVKCIPDRSIKILVVAKQRMKMVGGTAQAKYSKYEGSYWKATLVRA